MIRVHRLTSRAVSASNSPDFGAWQKKVEVSNEAKNEVMSASAVTILHGDLVRAVEATLQHQMDLLERIETVDMMVHHGQVFVHTYES
jgi:hypothetical protein